MRRDHARRVRARHIKKTGPRSSDLPALVVRPAKDQHGYDKREGVVRSMTTRLVRCDESYLNRYAAMYRENRPRVMPHAPLKIFRGRKIDSRHYLVCAVTLHRTVCVGTDKTNDVGMLFPVSTPWP